MKKIAFFCCALLALGFASCDDKSDLGTIQTNPQLPEVTAADLVPALSNEMAASSINLNGLTEIAAISAPEIENLPAGAEVVFDMELATKADFSNATTLPVVDGKVSAEAWDAYYREMLGMNNKPQANYVRFLAYYMMGSQKVRVGNLDTFYGSHAMTVTPVTFEYKAAKVYVNDTDFVYIPNVSGDGKYYQGMVQLDAKKYYFNVDGTFYGKDGSNVVEGKTPFTVSAAGMYIVELNMDKGTAKATQARSVGAIGDFNKWAKQVNLIQNSSNPYLYEGVVEFVEPTGEANTFKFRFNNNNTLTLGGYQYDLLFGGVNMEVPGVGTYSVTLDFSVLPYKYTYTPVAI